MLSLRVLDPIKDNISAALALRKYVFGDEEGLLSKPDEDEYDYLPSTKHLLVNDGLKPVSTARLLFRNDDVARDKEVIYGLAVEELLNLFPLNGSGKVPAECGRIATLKEYRRKTGATRLLLAGAYWVSRDAKVDVWVATVNAQTAAACDAYLMSQVASARRLEGPWCVGARVHSMPSIHPPTTFYEAPHWARALRGELRELPLPEVLTLFVNKMGAHVMGAPLFLPDFSRWAIPISAFLSEIPARTLTQFNALEQALISRGEAPRRAA